LADDHAEQRGLAGAVRADHADNSSWRQLEGEIVDKKPLAEALLQMLGVDDDIAEPRPRWDGDLRLAATVLPGLRQKLFIGADAGLGLRLACRGARPDPVELARQRPLARLVLLALDFEPLRLLLEP
jgi:hypothetical protein